MSTPVPLTVRVSTVDRYGNLPVKDSRLITNQVHDLTFRWTDPGGFSSCTVSLSRPLTGQSNEIDYFGTLTVTDARNGYVVWEGRLEDPARKADGSQGQVWELSAIGGAAAFRDVVRPRIYVDSTFAGFSRVANTSPSAQDSLSDDPGGSGKDAMVLQFPSGMTATVGLEVVMRNEQLLDCGQTVALVRYSWDAGINDGNYKIEVVQATSGAATVGASHGLATAGSPSPVEIWAGTHFPADRYRVEFKLRRFVTQVAVTTDNVWASIMDTVVVGSRTTRDGTAIAGIDYNPHVFAHEVIEDLLGDYGDWIIDKSRANVAATAATPIKQLAYVDGADVEAVLTDLMAIESGYTWRVWDRDGTSGGYTFEWVPIPTSVRYEADVIDGYDSNSSGEGIYNGVSVRWRDATGKPRTTTVTNVGDQPGVLTFVGIDRTAQIELGDEIGGSEEAAIRAGEQWLGDRATPANAGRLRIARPIMDFEWGRMVQPWEIRPGLIRVRGVLPRPDALNATSRDGVTVFRIVGCEYSAADGAATLELDSYPPSMAQVVGQLRELTRPGSKRRDWLNRPRRK